MQHPAGLGSSSPLLLFEKIYGEAAIAFRKFRPLDIRKVIVFEATYPRPTRSRAYASPASLPRPSQGSLPARAPLGAYVSSPWPGGIRTRWTTNRNFKETSHSLLSQSTSRAWSH